MEPGSPAGLNLHVLTTGPAGKSLLPFFIKWPFQDPQWLLKIPVIHCHSHSSQKNLPVIFCTRFTKILFILLTMLLPSPSFKQTHIFCLLDGGVSNLPLLKIYPDVSFSSHFINAFLTSYRHQFQGKKIPVNFWWFQVTQILLINKVWIEWSGLFLFWGGLF